MGSKRYGNLDGVVNDKSFLDVMKWMRNRPKKAVRWNVPQHAAKRQEWLRSNRTECSVTWIGHSTFLIQYAGLNIVTDPVWASRMGMARRLTEPGLKLGELPPVDIVLISHSHYDHLHYDSLLRLPGKPAVFVPDGLGLAVRQRGIDTVAELPWWGKTKAGGVAFSFVPAQHWTRRSPWDMNTSHWGGWVIGREGEGAENGRGRSIYYAGDSGYFRGFRDIGERFRIGTALLPIGAYEPEWFMQVSHMTPEEAVQAFEELGAETFVPMHYGAFMLADDTPEEAVRRLQAEWTRRGLPAEALRLLELGETWIPGNFEE
ncbi:MBL fold metallo-hydrolase [Paenibacillus chartarius]|uniref:MBL fold metallo-hydrolase n=1 Tax=Paenibacillus chartarius TaxID=747481 RepID=A0ABV6DGA3_9BACL